MARRAILAALVVVVVSACSQGNNEPNPEQTILSPSASIPPARLFNLDPDQAIEVSQVLAFVSAYNGGHIQLALGFLAPNVSIGDCDYRAGVGVGFNGTREATAWLGQRAYDHDHIQIGSLFNMNPDSTDAVGIRWANRKNDALTALGFARGITPAVVTKAVFTDHRLIRAFELTPSVGATAACKP